MRLLFALAIFCASCVVLSQQGLDAARTLKLTAPRKWAIVIGASDYPELGQLKYARNDAREFADELISDFLFKPEDVTLLVDKDKADNAPTAKNIIATLDRICGDKRLDKGDLFIFYFSGHGAGTKKGDYLCPTDSTKTNIDQVGLPVKEVLKRIVAAGLKNVLIICDACRAGEQNPFGAELQQLADKANIAVMLGCSPGRRSYEYAELKHGAFTHFLLQEMRDESVREGTGVLWASNLADKVNQQVYDYTEPDHGKYAQQPASWNEKRQDVFLGQFQPKTVLSMAAFLAGLDRAKQKGGNAYAQGLIAAALFTWQEGLPAMAVEQLKILDGMGELTPKMRLLLAELLRDLGRDSEASRQFKLFLDLPESDYYRTAAISGAPLTVVTEPQRLAASIKLWQEDKEFGSALWAWTLAEQAGAKEQASVLSQMSSYYGSKGREGFFFAGVKAKLAGDEEKAISLFKRSLDMPGEKAVLHYALMKLWELYTERNEGNRLAELTKRAIEEDDKDSTWFWVGLEAQRLKSAKQIDDLMSLLKKATAGPASPYQIYDYVDSAGSRAGELLPMLEKQLVRHPLSWPIHAAIWVANHASSLEPTFSLSDEMKKYAEDPVELRLTVFQTLARILNEKEEQSPVESLLFNTKFFISLVPYNERFGPDPSLWYYLQRWAENCHRTMHLGKLAEARLYPAVYAGKCNAELMATAMTIAMNAGDDQAVDRIWKAAQTAGAGKTDEAWRYLVYLLCRERIREAELLLPKMPKPGRMIGTKLPIVVRAYLDALKGSDKTKIQATLDANEPDGIESTYLWMLTAALVGREERASSFFVNLLLKDDESYLPLQAAGLRSMWLEAVKKNKTEDVLSIADLTTKYLGNPLFSVISYRPNLKLVDYAGALKFGVRYSDQGGLKRKGNGTLTIVINPDGSLVGNMDSLSFKGKLDAAGNLFADGMWDGEKISLSTRMAPFDIYKGYADKSPQPVEILDSKLEQIIMELRISSAVAVDK